MWHKLLYSGVKTCIGPSTQGAGSTTDLKSRFCAIFAKTQAHKKSGSPFYTLDLRHVFYILDLRHVFYTGFETRVLYTGFETRVLYWIWDTCFIHWIWDTCFILDLRHVFPTQYTTVLGETHISNHQENFIQKAPLLVPRHHSEQKGHHSEQKGRANYEISEEHACHNLWNLWWMHARWWKMSLPWPGRRDRGTRRDSRSLDRWTCHRRRWSNSCAWVSCGSSLRPMV